MEIMQSMFSDQNVIKLEINYRKTAVKSPNIWRLKNTILKDKWIIEVSREIKYFELIKNQNTTDHKVWDALKTVNSGKFRICNEFIKKDEGSKIKLPLWEIREKTV